MSWTFTQPPKTKEPWMQYILKVDIGPLVSRSRFEELSLCGVRLFFSQRTSFLSLQQFSLLLQQHTQAFCLPIPDIPPSGGTYGFPKTLLRLHLTGTQNQLKNWNKMHKPVIIWTKQTWPAGETESPHQPAPHKKVRLAKPFFLALLYSVNGCGLASCQVASYNLRSAAHLFQDLIHITSR